MSEMRQKESMVTMMHRNSGSRRGMEAQPLANQQAASGHSSPVFFFGAALFHPFSHVAGRSELQRTVSSVLQIVAVCVQCRNERE